ncbi:protein Dml1p [[Candida] jaroonii]|uniref:Protein Dml1p n=1 Tax=[Candida] jaroonii TaxID=467808 RepID=A0ACA9Y9U0_9ASCO|nr:protein Dml1p [[Candida] jaroonii]
MEIVTSSASTFSNNVVTHLFNYQESYIPYKAFRTPEQLSYNDLMFLSRSKIGKRVNYSPGLLLFDVKNGLGSLNKYEYFEKNPDTGNLGLEIIHTTNSVTKNEYQKGLDNGVNRSEMLNDENIKYWSDFNKLIHKPDNLFGLKSWQANGNEITNVSTPTVLFKKFEMGVDEFKKVEDDVIESYRKLLEEADYFQGTQFFTDLDNSWGGFTNEMISAIKDEFFNYTSNNKFNMWTFAFMDPQINLNKHVNMENKVTKIRALNELSKNSSLLIPMNIPSGSNWRSSSEISVLINSVWEVLNDKSSNMNKIESDFISENRNIINKVELTTKSTSQDTINEYYKSLNISDRGYDIIDLGGDSNETIHYGYNKDSKHEFCSREFDKNLENITKIDTFPSYKYQPQKVKYSIDSSVVYDLKQHIEFIKRSRIEDKDDLLNDLFDLKYSYHDSPDFEYDSDE